ncbi:MAG: ECF transporter S component [Eubacterium sp.]|jgi:energy-coupling factor transport system substrate-specific component|nr:ECF transporter S component [Eubacterium sp.]
MKNRRVWGYVLALIFCAALLIYSLLVLEGREYYYVSLAIMLAGVILFVLGFENRRPSVAELTIIAVMCSIGVASRVSFFFFPQIKPLAAVVIITGISLGAESGFITGAVSAFVSNFYFGQGSWTPFQMFALGVVGFFAGIVFRKVPVNRFSISVYGLLSVVVIYGGIVDINTLFYSMGENTWNSILWVYGTGLPMNLMFGISTVIFLVLLHKPVLSRLTRVKIKYHLIEQEKENRL